MCTKLTRGTALCGLASVFLGIVISSSARADLLAYEPFDYDYSNGAIALVGQSGGTGFAQGWTDTGVSNNAGASAGDVVGGPYPGLLTAGGHGFMGDFNRVGRNMVTNSGNGGFSDFLDANTNIGKNGTTLYLSYSVRYSDPDTDPRPFWAMELHRDGAEDGNRILQTGQIDGSVSIKSLATGASAIELDSSADDAAHFVVMRFDFEAAGDGLKIFYDPTIGLATEPAAPTAEYLMSDGLDLSFDRISFANFNSSFDTQFLDFDEIRFGTTFASVTAVPEASAILALSLVGSLMACKRPSAKQRSRMRRTS